MLLDALLTSPCWTSFCAFAAFCSFVRSLRTFCLRVFCLLSTISSNHSPSSNKRTRLSSSLAPALPPIPRSQSNRTFGCLSAQGCFAHFGLDDVHFWPFLVPWKQRFFMILMFFALMQCSTNICCFGVAPTCS